MFWLWISDSTCITDNSKVIGNGFKLGDYISVGANSVVNKSFASNLMIAGVPAKEIKSALPWCERDGVEYISKVEKVESLKLKMHITI